MATVTTLLTDTVDPDSATVQEELAFISGVGANGDIADTYYWNSAANYGADAFAHKWGDAYAGTGGGTITYSFAPTANPYDPWKVSEESIIQAGLALWSAVANIQFVEVPYSDADPSQIVFHYDDTGQAQTATAYSATGDDPSPGQPILGVTTAAETTFDPPQIGISYLDSFTAFGGYGVDTVVHEEGHLLGLGHGGAYNGSVDPATEQFTAFDTRQWSLMSYINPWDSSAKYFSQYPDPGTNWGTDSQGYYREPTTWMPLDILAAQRLYGVATDTPLSGGQTFGFHCNVQGPIEPFFDFTINTSPVVTLWDEGTGNTLDVSGFSAPAVVDLRPGGFSSVDGMTDDIGIAFDTAIDTAIGGPGATTFIPNADSDLIVGGMQDTVEFAASDGNYHDETLSGGRVVYTAAAADTLTGIGALAFLGTHDTVASGVGGTLILGLSDQLFLSPVAAFVALSGADTVVTSSGAPTIQAQAAGGVPGNLVFSVGDTGLDYIGGGTSDTVVAAHGTVQGGTAAMVVYGSAPDGSIDYQGGSGSATVAGGTGSADVQGGAGGGLLVGGTAGNNVLVANGGAAVLFGEGSGDQLDLVNAATDYAVLGPGAETVSAASASGLDALYGGSGADFEQGGGGTTVFQAGHGEATMACGTGTNLFLFVDGAGGGSDVIENWGEGSDWVQIYGFAQGTEAQVLAGARHVGGSTQMTLPDGTQLTFLNAPAVSGAQFF